MADVLQDLLTFGVISWFVIFVISKFRKETMKETIEWIKSLIGLGGEEE